MNFDEDNFWSRERDNPFFDGLTELSGTIIYYFLDRTDLIRKRLNSPWEKSFEELSLKQKFLYKSGKFFSPFSYGPLRILTAFIDCIIDNDYSSWIKPYLPESRKQLMEA